MKAKRNSKRGGSVRWFHVALFCFVAGGILAKWHQVTNRRAEPERVKVELVVEPYLTPADLWRDAGIQESLEELLDPESVKARLQTLPAVESIERQPLGGRGPVRLIVHVRKPVARFNCPAVGVGTPGGEASMFLDRSGVVMPAASFRDMEGDLDRLPRIQSLKTEGVVAGAQLLSPAIQTAMVVIEGAEESGAGEVREVRQINDYSIVVDFNGGLTVQFPFDNPGGQLQKLRQLLSYAERVKRKLKTVNLILRRNIPVTFEEGTGEEFLEKSVQP